MTAGINNDRRELSFNIFNLELIWDPIAHSDTIRPDSDDCCHGNLI
jgi:hypothetical protein